MSQGAGRAAAAPAGTPAVGTLEAGPGRLGERGRTAGEGAHCGRTGWPAGDCSPSARGRQSRQARAGLAKGLPLAWYVSR